MAVPGRAIPHDPAAIRGVVHYVAMILRPDGRFLTNPFPPGAFAARFLAAVILPPLLTFAILNHPPPWSIDCRQTTGWVGPRLWGLTLLSVTRMFHYINQRFLSKRWDAKHANRPMVTRLSHDFVNVPPPPSSSMARMGWYK